MTEIVFMFPGQSSRYPEMIEKVTASSPECARIVRGASDVLGRDLEAHYRADNPSVFGSNRDVQVGLFLANHLHLALAEGAGLRARWSLGLSLGEYNHLVHIGALPFDAALRLIEARGRLYDEASGGAMVSVFPIDGATVERAIERLGVEGRAAVGLYNSPRQQVISGERAAVEQVVAALQDDGFVEAVEIEPRIPMHAPVFRPIGARFAPLLDAAPLVRPRASYVPNALGQVLDGVSPERIRAHLVEHTHRPVRWQASVDAVAARAGSPVFVEVGPRTVLRNLFGKGWSPGRRASTDADSDIAGRLRTLAAELVDAA